MKVLWLSAGLLLPLDKGGKLRTWHLMKHLARRDAITCLSYADPDQPRADLDGMHEVCDRLLTVPRRDVPKASLRFYADAARYLAHPGPYSVVKYRSGTYVRRLTELLRREQFDLLVCDFLMPVVNVPRRVSCPTVLFTHNVEAEIWRRHAETATHPLKRALLGMQWRRMLRFERDALDRFNLILTVSEADRDTFERLYPATDRKYHVVPTGVDTEYFSPAFAKASAGLAPAAMASAGLAPAAMASAGPALAAEAPTAPHLVFTGSMDWLPNEDGMLFFCRDILPRIRHAEPDVTLSIVGRAPTPAVRRLAEERGIEVTGRVDDVRPHVARGSVYIVPLRIGGGTRLKIFEAMAMGKAVVSTTIGAEGLPVTPGRDIAIADDPPAFADAVVRLLRDDAERRRLESAARALVVERYDWSAVAGELEDALLRAAGHRRDEAAPRDKNTQEAVA
jgi:polysaccharide biosynthesis protein PslH